MIILSIICVLLGVGSVGYAAWTKSQCIKLDQNTLSQNNELEQKNAELSERNFALTQENAARLHSKEIISQELDELSKKRNFQKEQLNQLLQQKQIINAEVEIKKAQIDDLRQNIETISGDLKATARASFEQYCDTLDYEYTNKEKEFDTDVENLDKLYADRHDALLREMFESAEQASKQREQLESDLDIIRGELEKIRATKAAAMDAQLREQEIKEKATFYTLQLNDADKRDVAYLQSIEDNLREARPLRMLIWSTFYRDKVNDLAARVGAVGASGIYKITHIDSGISYIGQAKDIKERWVKEVKEALGIDAPITNKRCNFMQAKGVDNFTFEILEKCSIAELNEKEKFYIDLYQTYEFGLNGNKGVG